MEACRWLKTIVNTLIMHFPITIVNIVIMIDLFGLCKFFFYCIK